MKQRIVESPEIIRFVVEPVDELDNCPIYDLRQMRPQSETFAIFDSRVVGCHLRYLQLERPWASPPYGDYTGYHANLTRDEALELALTVAASDAPGEVVVELDKDGDLEMIIREVS